MKEEWITKPFLECIENVTYSTKINKKEFLPKGRFPIISQEENFINGYWENESDVYKVEKPVVIFGDHTKILKFIDFNFVLGADGVKILKPREFLITRFRLCKALQIIKRINCIHPPSSRTTTYRRDPGSILCSH